MSYYNDQKLKQKQYEQAQIAGAWVKIIGFTLLGVICLIIQLRYN